MASAGCVALLDRHSSMSPTSGYSPSRSDISVIPFTATFTSMRKNAFRIFVLPQSRHGSRSRSELTAQGPLLQKSAPLVASLWPAATQCHESRSSCQSAFIMLPKILQLIHTYTLVVQTITERQYLGGSTVGSQQPHNRQLSSMF